MRRGDTPYVYYGGPNDGTTVRLDEGELIPDSIESEHWAGRYVADPEHCRYVWHPPKDEQ